MRKRGLETVYKLATQHQNVLYIGSDVGKGTLSQFQQEYPDRYFIEGISEQHVIGMAAGLAMNGKIPYVNTIATFLTRRCYDQIAMDVCLGNYPVRLYANGGGLVYAPLGPTHEAIDDIALMRALPNMTVFAPSDADEMERGVIASYDWPGPVYIRVAKGGDDIVSGESDDFEMGKAVIHREPGDVLFITTGVTRQVAIEVCEKLAADGVRAGIIHVHTIKPLDTELIDAYLRQTRLVISIEEHNIIGGLGSAIAERIAEGARHPKGRFKRLGIPDRFAEKYGRQHNLFQHFGFDAEGVLRETRELLEIL